MSFTSRLMSRLMHLPPAQTHDLVITHDIQIPMPDGVVLFADHYAPRGGSKLPTLLVRSPYGRKGFFSALTALPYAERGYQVLIQSCRGTAGSGGEFLYARYEHDDGLATISWIKQQEWFSGELATIGASYLGFVQWSVAADAGPELKAMVPQVTSADFNHFRFQGGSLNLETSLGWSTMMTDQAATGMRLSSLFLSGQRNRRLERAYGHLPLGDADRLVVHRSSQPFQEHIQHGPEDDYWKPMDVSARLGEVNAPAYFMAGWYDIFLDWQLQDYQALRKAGKQPYLLIGPWTHTSFVNAGMIIRESLAWLDTHVKGQREKLHEMPVQLFVMGANTWRYFADWPPPVRRERWYLQADGGLALTLPLASQPDRYRYDPADPTPAVGGNSLGAAKHMGPKDNRSLEARSDVLVYTSTVLEQDMEIIGPVTAELYVHSSLEHTDFFVRLCVVEESGKSINLCDSILRLTSGSIPPEPDGSLHISIQVWPTAYHFRRGQRIRVQVSSGAHPRFVRNSGSGEPLATGTKLCVADQSIYHDPEHPSAILLPVLSV
ncbi:MAG TPA: CocE/NonD family hydrolase [Ktedonobacteraceae bacterium]|nr:CocE/NonD family hydrolase [Ktedonobacteraceae bacterium]